MPSKTCLADLSVSEHDSPILLLEIRDDRRIVARELGYRVQVVPPP
jgi:hypothetical protein